MFHLIYQTLTSNLRSVVAAAFKKTEWWGAGTVICLQQGADFHMVQLTPLPLTVS